MSELGGYILILSGFCLLLRAALLSGKSRSWPTAPKWVRLPLLVASWVFISYGAVLIVGAESVPNGVVLIFFFGLLYNATHLANILRQRRNYAVSA